MTTVYVVSYIHDGGRFPLTVASSMTLAQASAEKVVTQDEDTWADASWDDLLDFRSKVYWSERRLVGGDRYVAEAFEMNEFAPETE